MVSSAVGEALSPNFSCTSSLYCPEHQKFSFINMGIIHTCATWGSHGIISYVVLDECNYSHSAKGELFCTRDKACSPFNESMTLSPPTNLHTASLLPIRQAFYAYKCVRVIVL